MLESEKHDGANDQCRTTRNGGPKGVNPIVPNNPSRIAVSRGNRTAVASVAAIGSVLAASSCCMPVLPFVFAAGVAGSSSFVTALQPYLLAVSAFLVAIGFYQARRAKQCRSRSSIFSTILLCTSALIVVVSVFFPQVLANAAANLSAK